MSHCDKPIPKKECLQNTSIVVERKAKAKESEDKLKGAHKEIKVDCFLVQTSLWKSRIL
jgi:hypothetical protein